MTNQEEYYRLAAKELQKPSNKKPEFWTSLSSLIISVLAIAASIVITLWTLDVTKKNKTLEEKETKLYKTIDSLQKSYASVYDDLSDAKEERDNTIAENEILQEKKDSLTQKTNNSTFKTIEAQYKLISTKHEFEKKSQEFDDKEIDYNNLITDLNEKSKLVIKFSDSIRTLQDQLDSVEWKVFAGAIVPQWITIKNIPIPNSNKNIFFLSVGKNKALQSFMIDRIDSVYYNLAGINYKNRPEIDKDKLYPATDGNYNYKHQKDKRRYFIADWLGEKRNDNRDVSAYIKLKGESEFRLVKFK